MATPRSARVAKPAIKQTRRGTYKAEEKQRYYELRAGSDGVPGLGKVAAAHMAGVTPKTARKWEDEWDEAGNPPFDKPRIDGAFTPDMLTPYAREAKNDFSVFQERYLGRVALPWQKEAAEQIARLVESPEREYIVCNAPPGSGKSTTFTHDIPIWLITKNRGIRICILSSTQKNAEKFCDRIKRTLEATTPLKAPAAELKAGISKDAQTTLVKDFGRFKPEESTTWTKDKIRVERPKGEAEHKDNTVEAFGVQQSFLGGRYDLVILDDVYDPTQNKTYDKKQEIKAWFTDQAESRLEPGGLFFLVMQRVDPEDISAHALDLEAIDIEDDEDLTPEEIIKIRKKNEELGVEPLPMRDGKRRRYRHMKYPAHMDDACKGPEFHNVKAPAWPDGCLLYPRRLTWRELKTKEKNDPAKYRVWYQQEDVDPGNVLVDPIWIKGGRGEDGVEYPGCWDPHRFARELPPGLTTDLFSFVSVDPSPSQFWAVEWWIWHEPTKEMFLIDLVRQRMSSAEFFDYNPSTGDASGVLVDMFNASRDIGAPISHLIPEVNAAQKFMYDQTPLVQWLRSRSISLMPHTTNAQNKNSQEFGIQMLQPEFRHGRIRIPGGQGDALGTRYRSLKLVDEVQRYRLDGTSSYTDDTVMAMWFARRAVGNLYRPKKSLPTMWRPGFVANRPNLGVIAG